MKANNGGRGMSEAAVKLFVRFHSGCIFAYFSRFVDRYIPGYVFFGELPPVATDRPPKWVGRGLVLCLDEAREVTNIGNL